MSYDYNTIAGCMIGGAAGDALGYEVEFSREHEIFRRFGKQGITSYVLHDKQALISDDTQMTMFTAAGLIMSKDGMQPKRAIYEAYKDWLYTQGGYAVTGRKLATLLAKIPGMYELRAPGTTCISSLGSGKCGSVDKPINNSKGCGGVMRVAPIALFDKRMSYNESDMLAAEAAAITHGHDLGYISAAGLAHIVRCIADGDTVEMAVVDSIKAMRELFADKAHIGEYTNLMTKAVRLAKNKRISDLDGIHLLGGGWVGEEALAIAVFCALRYPDDLNGALIAAVNHNGDSDSTGAVCGNIVGTAVGYEGIPRKFKMRLEHHDTILSLAMELSR